MVTKKQIEILNKQNNFHDYNAVRFQDQGLQDHLKCK